MIEDNFTATIFQHYPGNHRGVCQYVNRCCDCVWIGGNVEEKVEKKLDKTGGKYRKIKREKKKETGRKEMWKRREIKWTIT